MPGRHRNPAGVRQLLNSRTRPHHVDRLPDEPADTVAPVPEVLSPPVGLTKAERVYWDWFAPLLAGAKVLTPADVETLADYCRACVAVDERSKRLRKAYRGPWVVGEDGRRHRGEIDQGFVRMLDASVRGWIERKTKLAGELGLTAIARTRVAWSGHAQIADPVKQPTSKLAQLQQRAGDLRRPVSVPR